MVRGRSVANWCNLSTPLGLGIAAIGHCRVDSGPEGLLLAEGYRLGFPPAVAFTVGDVVISHYSWTDLQAWRPRLLRHEQAHSEQYALLGPLFLPGYTLAMAWSWLRTGDRAAANVFERLAGLEAGGYDPLPARPLMDVLAGLRSQSLRWWRERQARLSRSGRFPGAAPNGSAAGSPATGGVA